MNNRIIKILRVRILNIKCGIKYIITKILKKPNSIFTKQNFILHFRFILL